MCRVNERIIEEAVFQTGSRGTGCVYMMRVIDKDEIYIGHTSYTNLNYIASFKKRISNYLAYLRKGTWGRYPSIQEAYNNEQLEIRIVERCKHSDSLKREKFYKDYYTELGFTVLNKNEIRDTVKRKKHTQGFKEGAMAGEKNGNAKLKWADVHMMRKLHEEDGMSCKELAQLYNLNRNYCQGILSYKKWMIEEEI